MFTNPSAIRAPHDPLALAREPRSMHLLDIENLLGGPDFTQEMVEGLRASYGELGEVGPADHVVIAASHFGAEQVMFGWPTARPLFRSGPDGADQRLLEVIYHEGIEGRYSRIVLGSGDGIFAPVCADLERHGPGLTVVARDARSLSTQIMRTVTDIRYLDSSPIRSGSIA